jgi:hypothetical protein
LLNQGFFSIAAGLSRRYNPPAADWRAGMAQFP